MTETVFRLSYRIWHKDGKLARHNYNDKELFIKIIIARISVVHGIVVSIQATQNGNTID